MDPSEQLPGVDVSGLLQPLVDQARGRPDLGKLRTYLDESRITSLCLSSAKFPLFRLIGCERISQHLWNNPKRKKVAVRTAPIPQPIPGGFLTPPGHCEAYQRSLLVYGCWLCM